MRRPLCVFCIGTLGAELVRAFLPQAGFFVPLAAFFVLGALWWLLDRSARGYGVCLALGAVLGLGLAYATEARLERIQTAYTGHLFSLTAEVESVSASYYDGVVDAVLHVEDVGGERVDFRVECVCLPSCEAGDSVRGFFVLEVPDDTQRLDRYADGVALMADYRVGFTSLGESGSFRARTARLQKRLSEAIRRGIDDAPAGVLAAMVVGDRNALSADMREAYRAAGLSHVLVVSGMHVTILCAVFDISWPRRRLRSMASRRRAALARAAVAALLVGVTGFTPSVLRAAVAVWIASLGVWVEGPPDALTSLGVAGVLMTMTNSYAVCDIGFELSFAAVAGTLAGGALAVSHRSRRKRRKKGRLAGHGAKLLEAVCVSACASAATVPVLVLRGLSVSLYALVSSVAVLWLVTPIMDLGLAAALLGLVPWAEPVRYVLARCAAALVGLMDSWAVMVAGWPGAQMYFDTAYTALVCLLLFGLCGLAARWRLRPRVAAAGVLLAAVVAVTAGNAMTRGVVRVELAGSRNAPAIVATQNGRAVVLFRGGADTQRSVETILARRGVREIVAVVDLRMTPQTECTLAADMRAPVARMSTGRSRTVTCGDIDVELLRTAKGGVVRLTIGQHDLVTLCGEAALAQPTDTEWLLASGTDPTGAVRWQNALTRSTTYRWMDVDDIAAATLADGLVLRPDGGVRIIQ